ncbi:phosphoinositide 3-kinase regulatory subunit 5 isoform X2 [Bombina bombina]|uniref:phosphoinositide 3-kinase regulatory subunit 5 isoform X2 n=1 Tax=Bombina bombina TaxID=8345 RepID=UPI00235A9E7B|nr:phosphoinositide 3-kinase regulatory subunit 5 isoform X2 [Bombina bombina]
MQNTSCTEDRIQHAVERCLHGLSRTVSSSSSWTAGLCLNYWSLEELVNRDAANYIILAEKIMDRTREAQENCEYDLLTPLALMFYFAVLRAPYIPPESDLLPKAFQTFHVFLTWPAPYCHIFQEVLSFISEEQRAPGISYQRLVRAEQGLLTGPLRASTVTVLLVNRAELPSDFLSVAEHLSNTEHSAQDTHISLIKHLYQANLGPASQLQCLEVALKSKALSELQEIYSELTEALEMASMTDDSPGRKRECLKAKLLDIGKKGDLMGNQVPDTNSPVILEPIPLPVAKCYTFSWDQDNFDVLNNIILKECEAFKMMSVSLDDEVNEEDEDVDEGDDEEEEEINGPRDSVFSTISKAYVYWNMSSQHKEDCTESTLTNVQSFVSSLSSFVDSGYVEDCDESFQESPGKLDQRQDRVNRKFTQKFCQLFKSKGQQAKLRQKAELKISSSHPLMGPFLDSPQAPPLRRAGSLYTPKVSRVPARSKRSQSLPQHALGVQFLEVQQNHKVAFKRRPYLSCDEENKTSTLRVVVFGSDRISGKVARAYSNLRLKESNCPFLTTFFKLQFYYIPVKRNNTSCCTTLTNSESPIKSPSQSGRLLAEDLMGNEESTNDITHYIGMLDPWYKRNIVGLMDLSTVALCQQSKPETDGADTSKMPILADMILYYCRFATRSVLLQLYQAEITFDDGRKETEVFIQSLELGHSANMRAIKASGPGSKRLGIDGDREAIPFTLQIVYSKSSISGRSRWSNGEKVCTSVSFRKACKTYEELNAKMECLNLTVREVVKRQNSKTKKNFNQISISQIKVDKAQIIAQHGGTFPLCLDQDERKILQRVVKCEVSPCYKPVSHQTRRINMSSLSHAFQDQSDFCSLLCLPVATFSGAQL